MFMNLHLFILFYFFMALTMIQTASVEKVSYLWISFC